MKNLLETVISDYKIHNSIELRNWQLQAMKNLERLISNRPISVLVDATCGSGKSTVQHMAIDYVARLKEAEGKKAMILLASPRLLLNKQLLECCKSSIKDFDDRFTVLNMASNDLGDAKFDMLTSTGFGISNKLNSNKHIILLACDTSVNMDFDNAARQIESRIMHLASHRTKNGHEVTFDLTMIDEAHKDIDNSVLVELKKMSNTLITYTATPSKRLSKICSTKRISYGFRQAIKDGVVVPPSLYLVSRTNKLKEKDKATSIVASIKHLINEAENTPKLGYDKRAVEVVFDNSIDYLRNYENTLRSIYTIDELDIAILASEKEVAVYHFGEADKYESYEDLRYEKFSNVELAKSIISKLEAHENISEHITEGNGNYYVTTEIMRGHHEGGLPKWDWLTLMPEDWREDYSKKELKVSCCKRCQFFFNTVEEARNFRISLETDISMFALFILKVNRRILQSTVSYIPWLSDYTRSWNDDQIAKEVDLTREELDYIHEEMKNFGWKCAKKTAKKAKK